MANELRVRQLAVGGLVEDAPLASGATTLTSAGLAAVSGGIGSTQHLAIVLDPDGIDGAPEIIYVTALTNGAGSATVARGQEGTTTRAHVAGTPWVHGPTLRDAIKAVQVTRRTGTSILLNSTAIAEVAAATNGPGTGGFDLTLSAVVGDILELGMSATYGSEAVQAAIDGYTMVSGTRTNPFGAALSASLGSTAGVPQWFGDSSGRNWPLAGSVLYVVVSGDISSGNVTVRPHYVTATAANRTLASNANLGVQFFLKNLGPPSA